jgi:Tripartite ATP-independent periplasmic transporter, DctM component
VVLSLQLTPVQFMIVSQAIIFLLGWPLEWTEIIVIFVPIFLPMLKHFNIDPVLWGVLVFVNLQAAFLSPPVAMAAFYLKGVAPPHVSLNQIFSGMMPLYVDRHRVHDIHVSMARHDALAAELSLRQLTPMTPLSVSPKSDGAHLITARPGVCTQPYRPRLVAGRGHQDHLRIAVSAPAAHVMVPPLVTRQSVLARRV